jgi:glycosyltransferase involved in cell wall biosynthesis
LIVACIPCYNEESHIARVVLGAQAKVDKVVVCDDGSKDLTGEIAERLGAEVIRHSNNQGYGAAISTLLRRAKEMGADVVVTLDGDGQHEPREIPLLTEPVLQGMAEIVIGSRFLKVSHDLPEYRSVGIKIITGISNQVNSEKLTDAQSGFRAYSKRALDFVVPAEMSMGAGTEILMRAGQAGLRIAEVPIKVTYGKDTSTHNPLFHGVIVVFSMLKHLSIQHPLIVYGISGLAFSLLGLYLGWRALHVFADKHIVDVGNFLLATGSVLIGVILMAVAIILWVMVSLIREDDYRR